MAGGFRLCRDTLWVFGIFGTGDRDPHGIVLNRLRRDNERRISALRCNNKDKYLFILGYCSSLNAAVDRLAPGCMPEKGGGAPLCGKHRPKIVD